MTDEQFDSIFRREYPRLYRLAYSLLRNQEECRDIVSQVMTGLYERPPRETDNQQALAAYLSRTVRSRCIDYIEHLEIEQRAQKLYPLEYRLQIDNDQARESRLKEVWRFINEQLTLLYDKASLEQVIVDLTAFYHLERPEFRDIKAARKCMLHISFSPESDIHEAVALLNQFGSIHVEVVDNKLVVK